METNKIIVDRLYATKKRVAVKIEVAI